MEFILPRILIQLYAEQFPLEVGSMVQNCVDVFPGYVARTRQYWNSHDTWIRDKFFKIHKTRVSDTLVGHDTAQR